MTSPFDSGALGLGFRPEIAGLFAPGVVADLTFTEVVAETIDPDPDQHLHPDLQGWLDRGLPVVPHGVSLGIGGADRPDDPAHVHRLERLGVVATRLGAALVSEHIAFVRAGGQEIGHLTPISHDPDTLAVLVENVRIAQDLLPVPLALEHVATLVRWPTDSMRESDFLNALVEQTGVQLVVDVANLVVNAANAGSCADARLRSLAEAPEELVDRLPWHHVAYLHIAGGERLGGLAHDTHRHPVWPEALDLLMAISDRCVGAGLPLPPVLLERDDDFPPLPELADELIRIRHAITPLRVGAPAGHP